MRTDAQFCLHSFADLYGRSVTSEYWLHMELCVSQYILSVTERQYKRTSCMDVLFAEQPVKRASIAISRSIFFIVLYLRLKNIFHGGHEHAVSGIVSDGYGQQVRQTKFIKLTQFEPVLMDFVIQLSRRDRS